MGTYAPATIGINGLTVPQYQAILSYLLTSYTSIYGSTVYLGSDSPDYQDIAVRALQAADVNSGIQAVSLSFNPQTAIGTSLDLIGKLIGTARKKSTFSTAVLTLTGTIGAVITSGIAQDVNGDFWNLPTSVTIGSGGTVTAIATAQNLGNITANPAAINIIATPTLGWTAVTNAAAANPGEAVEPDSSYRARLLIAQAKPSLTLLAGTSAAVAAVSGVTRSVVYENPNGFSAGYGLVSTSGTAITLTLGFPFDSSDALQSITINGAFYSVASVGGANALTLSSAIAATTTGTALITSTALTVASATNIAVGQAVSGTGIAGGTLVSAISGLLVTLSIATTGAITGGTINFSIGTQTNVPYFIGDGIAVGPPHSITAVVEGGTSANIAQAIYDNKNPGVLTNGTTSVVVTDPLNGNISMSISFDILSYVEIYVALNVHPLTGFQSATQDAIQSAILTYLDSLGIGESVVYSQLYTAAGSAQPNQLQPTFSIRALISGSAAATTSAVTTITNPVIAVTSATGIANGQTAVGVGIPPNTTVSSISGTNITLSAAATASGTVPITFFSTGTADIPVPYQSSSLSALAQVVVNIV